MTRLAIRLSNWTDKPVVSYSFLVLLIVFAFTIGFFKISNYDIWWHMKTGEWILSHGIPSTDPFSFTAHGHHWVTHEWLAEVIFYLLYRLGGIAALILFKAVASALVAYVIFDFGTKYKVSSALAAAAAMLAVAGMSYMMYARPHAFSFLFLAIEAAILFGARRSSRERRLRRWVILPAIFLAWANLHASFLLGLGIYWVVASKELLLPLSADEKFAERLKRTVIPALLHPPFA